MNTLEMLKQHCENVAHDWINWPEALEEIYPGEEGYPNSAYDFIDHHALDIVDMFRAGEYAGSRIAVSIGGPNIWIDTMKAVVEGSWAGKEFWQPIELPEELTTALMELAISR